MIVKKLTQAADIKTQSEDSFGKKLFWGPGRTL